MHREVRLGRMSLTMEHGLIVEWLKRDGDAVTKGEVIAQVETDKAVVEVESPAEGVLTIVQAAGKKVPVDTIIALIE